MKKKPKATKVNDLSTKKAGDVKGGRIKLRPDAN